MRIKQLHAQDLRNMSILNYFSTRSSPKDSELESGPSTRICQQLEADDDHDSSASGMDSASDEDVEPPTADHSSHSSTASASASGRGKQATRFSNDWLKGREDWLKYIRQCGMFCTLCQKYNKQPFARDTWNKTPCRRFRFQSILKHECSAAHKHSIKLEQEQTRGQTITALI